MRRLLPLLIAASMLSAAPGVMAADTAGPLVSVSAASTDAPLVLQRLAAQAGVPFYWAADVKGALSLSLTNVPLEDALTAISTISTLRWRRVIVPKGADVDSIRTSLESAQKAPTVSVMVEATGQKPAFAVLAGADAEKAVPAAGAQLPAGMIRAYWVYNTAPQTSSGPAAATTDQPTEAAAAAAPVSQATVYREMTKWLSNLQPADALGVVDRMRGEVIAAMTPYERQVMLGEGVTGPSPAPPYTPPFLRSRVRMTTPGGGGVFITPMVAPWYGAW